MILLTAVVRDRNDERGARKWREKTAIKQFFRILLMNLSPECGIKFKINSDDWQSLVVFGTETLLNLSGGTYFAESKKYLCCAWLQHRGWAGGIVRGLCCERLAEE